MGGVWGTIAADSIATPWNEKNAQVACIELGFSGTLNAVFQRTYDHTLFYSDKIIIIILLCHVPMAL